MELADLFELLASRLRENELTGVVDRVEVYEGEFCSRKTLNIKVLGRKSKAYGAELWKCGGGITATEEVPE